MHVRGVPGNFRVDFLVGNLDPGLPLNIDAKTHPLLSLEFRFLSRLIFPFHQRTMDGYRIVNDAVLRPLAHGDGERITADADLHVPREAADAAHKHVRRAVRQNRCCEPVAGLLVATSTILVGPVRTARLADRRAAGGRAVGGRATGKQRRFLSLFNYGIMTILPAKYGQCPFFVTFQLRHNDDFACQIRPMPSFFVTFQLRRNGGLQTKRKFEVQL